MNKVLVIALCFLMGTQAVYGCCGTGTGCCSSTCYTASCTSAMRVDNNNNIIQENDQDSASDTQSTQDEFSEDEAE